MTIEWNLKPETQMKKVNTKFSPNFRDWLKKWDALPEAAQEVYFKNSLEILDICKEIAENREELVGQEKFGLREEDKVYLKSKIQEFEQKYKT